MTLSIKFLIALVFILMVSGCKDNLEPETESVIREKHIFLVEFGVSSADMGIQNLPIIYFPTSKQYAEHREMEEKTYKMIENIHDYQPTFLKFAPSMTKGYMLYTLSNYAYWGCEDFMDENTKGNPKDAAMKVIRIIDSKEDWYRAMSAISELIDKALQERYINDRQYLKESQLIRPPDQNVREQPYAEGLRYLRNGLLGETDHWDKVLAHINSLE